MSKKNLVSACNRNYAVASENYWTRPISRKKIQNKKCNNSHHSRVERPHDPYEQDDAKHGETGQGVDGPEIQIQKQYIFFLFLFGNSLFLPGRPVHRQGHERQGWGAVEERGQAAEEAGVVPELQILFF